MLTVLFNWLYIGVTTYLSGNACLRFLEYCIGRKDRNRRPSPCWDLFAGIMCTTSYAQIYSLFGGVGLYANGILLVFCLGYGLTFGKKTVAELDLWIKEFLRQRSKIGNCILTGAALGLLLVFSLCTAGPAKLIDTDWYHAQTIRWIEEYGCVTGVANLFYSLGFNSAQHYFDALYSMKGFLGQSLHAGGGYFGYLICLHGLFRLADFKNHQRHIADASALTEIVYSIIVTAFFADPYTDTLPNCLVFFILTEWLALIEEKEEEIFPYAFLCILGVFATVVKTSVVVVVLLVLRPAVRLIKKKEWKKIAGYLLTGILVAVPFFITNIKTSGYLVYLASGVDLFDVPWKVDKEVLKYSVDSMVYAARTLELPMEEVLNRFSWVKPWFRNDSISHRILYIAVTVLLLFDLVGVVCSLFKKQKQDWDMALLRGILWIGLIYWFLTIPQVKYCWAFLLFPLAVIPTYWLEQSTDTRRIVAYVSAFVGGLVLLLYTGFYGLRTLGYVADAIPDYLVRQADYAEYEMIPVTKEGMTFYVREEGGDIVCGYYVFPYLNDEEMLEQLVVGEKLEDGFSLSH